MPKKATQLDQIGEGFDDVMNVLVSKDIPNKLPIALYHGELPIGGVDLSCVVLDDERRILPASSVFKAFNRQKRGLSKERQKEAEIKTEEGVLQLPAFVAAKNLKPFIDNDLTKVLRPVVYLDGEREVEGYDATILPDLCRLYLDARREGVLTAPQAILASQAEILASFAKIGIIALIDEATGFQKNRKNDALRILINYYIREDARQWTKEFTDAFFEALDGIYGKEKTTSRSRPPYYGRFINSYVYEPIEHGIILSEIKKLKGTDKKKQLHLFLNDDHGLKVLRDRIGRITALLVISRNMQEFKNNYEKMEIKQQWFNFDELD